MSIRYKVDKAVMELLASKDPRNLGHALNGRWEGCYSYVIGRKFRLIYAVNFKKRTIYFLSVGPHTIYR